jgi:hypothetical protein
MLENILSPLTLVKTSDTDWIDLTGGGETDLHTHAGGTGGGGGVLLSGEYNPSATGGILLCSQYDPSAT